LQAVRSAAKHKMNSSFFMLNIFCKDKKKLLSFHINHRLVEIEYGIGFFEKLQSDVAGCRD